MKTFFLTFRVTPTNANEHFDLVTGGLAHCWIRQDNPRSARAEAEFHIARNDWEVKEIEGEPVEVREEHFAERDLGLEQYLCAQEEGVAVVYIACARDGKTTAGPILLRQPARPPLSRFLKKQKQLTNKGRCLHYESGHRCNKIIKAHSIQRSMSLSAIAEEGHVYKLSNSMSSLKRNKGQLVFEKHGINKVSTFLGFCGKHDNQLFKPIDDSPLLPTDQQVLLYAYRSLCRELFVKENTLELIKGELRSGIRQSAIERLLLSVKQGTAFGLKNLRTHKELYDRSLQEEFYSDIRYVLFISKQKPTIAFSGVFYPDFDFVGRRLQNLADHNIKLQLISICSVPMDCGWGFLFAWHVTSSSVCVDFMRALATMMHRDNKALGDILFRLVMINCENLAISPKWWEGLPKEHKEDIALKVSVRTNPFSITGPFYLMKGFNGISRWDFGKVISKME